MRVCGARCDEEGQCECTESEVSDHEFSEDGWIATWSYCNDGAGRLALPLQPSHDMLKLVGSYVVARLLGFGILGAIVIYALFSLLT